MTDDYRVQLDVFTGPLDLLLYLIRRDEVDIQDIQIARLTEQYLEYVKLLEHLDPNAAGDFLVMASTLVELKSRALLPSPPLEADDEDDDPRASLVRQLLEYKRFKDAAEALGRAADERQRRYARRPANLPRELEGVELEEAQVWDLLAAFGRVMAAIGQGPGLHEVTYDETPVSEWADLILDTIERQGPTKFQDLFSEQYTRAEIVGLFLAMLELIRNHRLRAEQDTLHGDIYLFILDEVPEYDEPEQQPTDTDDGETEPEEGDRREADADVEANHRLETGVTADADHRLETDATAETDHLLETGATTGEDHRLETAATTEDDHRLETGAAAGADRGGENDEQAE